MVPRDPLKSLKAQDAIRGSLLFQHPILLPSGTFRLIIPLLMFLKRLGIDNRTWEPASGLLVPVPFASGSRHPFARRMT